MQSRTVKTIDSHTAGEPTRLIISSPAEMGIDLGAGPMSSRLATLRDKYDELRSAVVCEPRGSDVIVGALLCKPVDPRHAAGVIFFNNVGYLGMCGHGTIGVIESLRYLGRIKPGTHIIETPVGNVTAVLHDDGRVSVQNVASHRSRTGITVEVPGLGPITGDVAYGGNWFFLATDHRERVEANNIPRLTDVSSRLMAALEENGVTGVNGAKIDHIELFGPPINPANHSRNFVLCPGGAYDRSPCGTGTSAKLACLAADGKLKPGEIYRQESIIGSVFEASYQLGPSINEQPLAILPTITGRAFVTAEATLILDPQDPFRFGIR